ALGQDRQPDPRAMALLREVYARRETWNAAFPGFEARAVVHFRGQECRGTVRVGPDYQVAVSLPEREAERWVRETLVSLAGHRRPTRLEDTEGRHPMSLGPEDGHPSGRLLLLRDPTGSTYRIRDSEIRQVNRVIPGRGGREMKFTIEVLETRITEGNRRLPRAFTVSYYDGASARLLKSESHWESYRRVGDYYLPEARNQFTAEDGGNWTAGLRLEEHRLLNGT
ncbi:MAG: DUF3386 family protein, partial [Armatimonadetes bacterium]|nr:DUF3386 family protein [Armatimonadota bacterium]